MSDMKPSEIVTCMFSAFCSGAILTQMLMETGHHYISLRLGVPALIITHIIRFILRKEERKKAT